MSHASSLLDALLSQHPDDRVIVLDNFYCVRDLPDGNHEFLGSMWWTAAGAERQLDELRPEHPSVRLVSGHTKYDLEVEEQRAALYRDFEARDAESRKLQ